MLQLCREFGPEHVGLTTGDATVNRDAPILCCTAEILANIALREGAGADVQHVVMDEFHYYADRERGVAWQVPLLTLPQARFLLMSATLGETAIFEEGLTRLNGRAERDHQVGRCGRCRSSSPTREMPLAQTVEKLVAEARTPVYVVHFTQADAAQQRAELHQPEDLHARSRSRRSPTRIADFAFSSPYGTDIRKWLRHGIGLHHAGLLPKYRVLVEQLAQRGLLKVICGTDTLGVGRQRADPHGALHAALQVRRREDRAPDARATSTRSPGAPAARASTTPATSSSQAPEHVIENLRLEEKATGREEDREAQAAARALRPLGSTRPSSA